MEDEYHFDHIPMYKEEREKLKWDLQSKQTTKRQTIHDKELLDLLFSCNENHSGKISKFINSIAKIREEKLDLVEILIIPFWLFNL